MAKKRAREADGAAEDPDKMVEDGDSSDDEVRLKGMPLTTMLCFMQLTDNILSI